MPLQDSDIFLVTKADGSESRYIQAQNLFSGIADDWYVVIQEGTESKRCLVSELVDKKSDDRYMLVNSFAPGVTTGDRDHSYKIKSSTVVSQYAKQFTDVITNVGTAQGVNYAPYTYIWDLYNNSRYTGTIDNQSGSENSVYDGNESTSFYRYRRNEWLGFRFEPPSPIRVLGQIEVKGGFHTNSPLGQMLINGQVVKELSATDVNPQWFTATYSGLISTIELRQKHATTGDRNDKSFGVNAFKIDGEYLISNKTVTELTFSSNKGLSDFTYNDAVTQVDDRGNPTSPAATGHVGEVYGNKMSLLKIESNWAVGNYIELPELEP